MSFDPGVYDPEVFGAQSSESCLFDGAVFDSDVFDVCVDAEPPADEEQQQPSIRPVRRLPRGRPRYWWEKEERAETFIDVKAPQPVVKVDFGPLDIIPRAVPFQATPNESRAKKRKVAMLVALLDE